MGADTFEAREGWVPANTEGSVWCYRTRGNAGVLAFRRTEDGQSLYEATHQDCYASDETITTTRRIDAVRFAATGSGSGTGASAENPAEAPSAATDTPSRTPPAPPETPPAPAPTDKTDAMRTAWDRYIDATSEFLQHIKANLDDPTHADLRGNIDQALALVRDGATKSPQPDGHDRHDANDAHDALTITLGAVLREARALIAAKRLES